MEKFIEHARHIEIQVMADAHGNVVYLGERECSTQRRHQKLIEEAPSPAVDAAMRRAMGECAVSLTRNADYCGAGTIEFVVDQRDNKYFFLEMNTRIQVEHPVTEMITGFDLVAEQIRVAGGLPLSFTQADVQLQGHAIECRINAEDPERNFLPRPGLISRWEVPSGEGVRVDTHCYAGYTVPPYYDSLLGKLIVHAPTREQAIERMRGALAGLKVEGPTTTAPFHDSVLAHEDFVNGKVTTRWVEETFLPQRKAAQKAAAQAAKSRCRRGSHERVRAALHRRQPDRRPERALGRRHDDADGAGRRQPAGGRPARGDRGRLAGHAAAMRGARRKPLAAHRVAARTLPRHRAARRGLAADGTRPARLRRDLDRSGHAVAARTGAARRLRDRADRPAAVDRAHCAGAEGSQGARPDDHRCTAIRPGVAATTTCRRRPRPWQAPAPPA